MTCDRHCNNSKCARRACETVPATSTLAPALRDIYRAMRRGDLQPDVVKTLETFCEALPDRVGPRRLLIEALITRGELTRAEEHLGRALLTRPNHRRLTLLRCKCLILLCDFTTAIDELHRWLPNRPWDVEAHALAGEAAALADRHDLAAGHFAMACAYATHRVARRAHLARAHIEANKLEDAQQWIVDIGQPSPRLDGLLAARRGELFRASDYLYRAVADAEDSLQRQLALVDLLNVRRRLGYPHGLRQAIALVFRDETLAQSAAAEALIRLGSHREAALAAQRITRRARRHHCASAIATVASAMCERNRSAVRSLRRQSLQHVPADTALTSRLWRAGIFQQIVAAQRHPKAQHGNSPSLLLQPVLERAAKVFEDRLRTISTGDAAATHLRRQRAECLIALGRRAEAMAGMLQAA